MLCLETVNVPIRAFDSVQLDLLCLFEAVARSRGLEPGLALATGCGTWNYANRDTLTASRRFRQGTRVRLEPMDPAIRRLYTWATGEAGHYDPLETEQTWLAPFDPAQDRVLPENLDEAARLC